MLMTFNSIQVYIHVAERELRGEHIPDKPPYRGGGNRSKGRTQEVQGGKVSFREIKS
jgi:hypothetical protein